MKKKLLIIGYGSIGKRHSEIIKENFKNIDLYLFTNQKIKKTKILHDIEYINNFDFIIICSETYKHYEQIKFIEKKCKNKKILVEKPLFHNYKKLNIKNNKFFVGYNLRFHPYLQYIKKFIKNKKIFKISVSCNSYLPKWRKINYRRSYSSSKKLGGGVLLDLSHEFDYLSWIFGKINFHSFLIGKKSNLQVNTEDSAIMISKIKNIDVVINLDFFSLINRRELIIDAKNFSIHLDLVNSIMKVVYLNKIKNLNLKNYSINQTYIDELKDFFKKKPKFLCTYKEALKTNNLIDLAKLK